MIYSLYAIYIYIYNIIHSPVEVLSELSESSRRRASPRVALAQACTTSAAARWFLGREGVATSGSPHCK
jgi:hypothetical protein